MALAASVAAQTTNDGNKNPPKLDPKVGFDTWRDLIGGLYNRLQNQIPNDTADNKQIKLNLAAIYNKWEAAAKKWFADAANVINEFPNLPEAKQKELLDGLKKQWEEVLKQRYKGMKKPTITEREYLTENSSSCFQNPADFISWLRTQFFDLYREQSAREWLKMLADFMIPLPKKLEVNIDPDGDAENVKKAGILKSVLTIGIKITFGPKMEKEKK